MMLELIVALLLMQVNNAAVSFNEIDTNSVEHAETVLQTNFYGTKLLTEALLPLFRRSPATSRILNISSQLGLLNVSARIAIFFQMRA
jgi:NAD(P)-dependent dehydrogenase (short-subunit alcohol dehydrogenase family)